MCDARFHWALQMLRSVPAIWLVLLLAITVPETLIADDPPVSFNNQIRPILNEHCTACHGGVKQAGDISFVYRDQVVAPEGWVVEPGDPEGSPLIDRVQSDDPTDRMPPPEHGRALTKQEIELLTRWIDQGAKWGGHWAYSPLIQPRSPEIELADWPRKTMDNFVLHRLESQRLNPAADAVPERWLRRVTLDLTGLPPTVEQRQVFLERLADANDSASRDAVYRHVVEQLIESPRYGERWASVWLDQVRYADSKGLGVDGKRNIWKFRDWVIDSLNRDLPYDQFTIKQIAGDLLPNATVEDHIATAAHRATQSNEEGGTDDEEFRVAAVLDRVNTTWQTWQGVTFGCVQCHSHPYDPFRHEEYYEFAAFFNNTADTDLNEDWPVIQAPVDSTEYDSASKLDRQINDLRNELWRTKFKPLNNESNWTPLKHLEAKSNNATKVAIESMADHDEYHTVDTVSQNTDFTLTAPVPNSIRRLAAIRFTAMPLNPAKAATDSEWGFSLSHVELRMWMPGDEKPHELEIAHVIGDEPEPFFDPNESLNPKSNRGFSAYSRIYQPRQAAFVLKSPTEVPAGSRIEVVLKHRVFLLGAFPLIAKRGHLAVSDSPAFASTVEETQFIRKKEKLAALESQRAKIKSTSVPVLRERHPHLARSTHVFIRGLYLTKDEQVEASTPDSLPPLPGQSPHNRLSLANWIVSADNPLTARVAVNRVWARLFGVGLVATEEDFGSSGDAPSHPLLLDHLAWKFQHDFHWSQKALLREIVLSRTYRQSSVVTPEQLELDPGNRLLARGPRHRLSAEMVRDQALAVSGLLVEKMFGPPVHPPIPGGVWKPFAGGDKWLTPEKESEDRYRRSIYTYTKRSIPYPMFAAFDSPSREICTPRRLRSNTPIQALMTLNDTTFSECAQALADRMTAQGGDLRQQIEFGFVAATCRRPSADEVDELIRLIESYGEQDASAGLIAAANVLLNLDEFLTK